MLDLRRRAFLSLIGGVASWPLAARAQQPAPVIGFLAPTSSKAYGPYLSAFHRGLGAAGFSDGRNVTFEYRWADDQADRLPALAAELAARPVALIVTLGSTAAALAAKGATSTIPIVFAVGADPVKFGLVASMNRPGGNVTGVSFLSNALVSKQLELLHELMPSGTVLGILANPTNPNFASDSKAVAAAAASLGHQIQFAEASGERDVDTAVTRLIEARAAALLVFPDALFTTVRTQLAVLAARHRLPAIFTNRLYVEAGGLMSYGSSSTDAFREAGVYSGRILKGEKPADLPVAQSVRFELVINLKTAKALGLDVPPTLLARADEVIE